MNHDSYFLCEELLEAPASRVLPVLCHGGLYGLLVQHGEDLDVPFCVLVGDVEPELVELVWACAFGVEPDVSFFRLAEFLSVRLPDERAGEGIGFLSEHPADELRAGGDVAPLVAAAHLENTTFVLIEVEEVVALEELVAELCE